MAQAARLNLRLQKELKLLLTDPPHGATFPHLSPDSDPSSSSSSSPSLSTIHAQIRGPEGTVYAKGVFDIKIQIPERYPFQPPSVTFATPIYHPNIDNGGRICLDILNLPPKGAWQPSLNIWTVITSIGLLLSEPNPDDGLMCEASREYKYNRQAFDQKAISMTEKFAKAGVSRSLSIETKSNPSMMGVKDPPKSKLDVDKHVVDDKLSGNRRKLSLDASVSNPNRGNELVVEGRGLGSKGTLSGYSSSHDNPNGARRRLSLESYGQQQKLYCINLGSAVDNHCPLQATSFHKKHLDQDGKSIGDKSMCSESKQLCQVKQKQPLGGSTEACRVSNHTDLKGPLSVSHAIDRHDLEPQMGFIDKVENISTDIRSKKPCVAGKKLSMGYKGSLKKAAKEDKENVVPAHKLPLSTIQIPSSKPCVGQKLSAGPMIQLQGSHGEKLQCNQDHSENMKQQVTEEPPLSETVIVLDSEESEEETNMPVRSKLSLARRLGKWKAKA